jgi:hypothetical protein
VPEAVQVLQRASHARAVVEQHLAGGAAAGQSIADRDHGEKFRELRPERIGWIDRG